MFGKINKIKHYHLHPILEVAKGYLNYVAEIILPHVGMYQYLT